MFKISKTAFSGCFKIRPIKRTDCRGYFVKTYHEKFLSNYGLVRNFNEEYFSMSNANVIRGMHFQVPPYEHDKLVYCVQGSVVDVVLDLRPGSTTFKKYEVFDLNAENANMLFIPKGCAHGFLSLENNTLMMYKVTSMYNPDFDSGVLWNSFGFDWPTDKPEISERDQSFKSLNDLGEVF